MSETDILKQGRELAEQYNQDGGGFKNNERKNAYECDGTRGFAGSPGKPGCGSFIVTVDRAPGVTPFIVRCENCGSEAHSKFYRVADWLEPTHEWYRPDTLDGIPKTYHDHLSRGGLILRPIGDNGWRRPEDLPVDPKAKQAQLDDFIAKMKAAEAEAQSQDPPEMRKQLSRQVRRHNQRSRL